MSVDVRTIAQGMIDALNHEINQRKLQIEGIVKLYEGLIREMEKGAVGEESNESAGSSEQ